PVPASCPPAFDPQPPSATATKRATAAPCKGAGLRRISEHHRALDEHAPDLGPLDAEAPAGEIDRLAVGRIRLGGIGGVDAPVAVGVDTRTVDGEHVGHVAPEPAE